MLMKCYTKVLITTFIGTCFRYKHRLCIYEHKPSGGSVHKSVWKISFPFRETKHSSEIFGRRLGADPILISHETLMCCLHCFLLPFYVHFIPLTLMINSLIQWRLNIMAANFQISYKWFSFVIGTQFRYWSNIDLDQCLITMGDETLPWCITTDGVTISHWDNFPIPDVWEPTCVYFGPCKINMNYLKMFETYIGIYTIFHESSRSFFGG